MLCGTVDLKLERIPRIIKVAQLHTTALKTGELYPAVAEEEGREIPSVRRN